MIRRNCRDLKRQGANGSVSVFYILVTAGLLLFNAILIDYARVAAMNKQLEAAAMTGARSVLSAYDELLYERYGLFARGGTSADEIMGLSVDGSLSAASAAFKLTDTRREDSHVNAAGTLGHHPVFRRQLLEEMKYKAPIDFTLEVVSKFRPLAGVMKEATATVHVLEAMEKLYEARQTQLASAFKLQKQAAAAAVEAGIGELLPAAAMSAAGTATLLGIVQSHAEYSAWVASDAQREAEEQPLYAEAIAAYRQSALHSAAAAKQAASSGSQLHAQLAAQAQAAVEQAAQYNEQMRLLAQQAREAPAADGYDRASGLPGADNASDGEQSTRASMEQLAGIRAGADQLVMEASWFDGYRQELAEQNAAVDYIRMLMEQVCTRVVQAVAAVSMPSSLPEELSRAQAAYSLFSNRYYSPASIITARERQLEQVGQDEQQRSVLQQEADSKWAEARKLLDGLQRLPISEEQIEQFNKLQRLNDKNRLVNELAEQAGQQFEDSEEAGGDAVNAKRSTEGAKRAMNSLATVFGGMADNMQTVRDTLYINEYAFHRFRTIDPMQLRSYIEGAGEGALGDALNVDRQELEYILYGFHHPAANAAAAYSELFMVRLAIRTMEGLLESRSMGHPLVILSAALVYGLKHAMLDLLSFVREGSAPLSKYAAVNLTYKDYMRLFLLLHGSESAKLSRMIALIEYHSGYDLFQLPAAVSAEVTGSMRLWFLPGVMKRLAMFGILNGRVDGDRYETTKTAVWSYQ